MNLPDPLHGWPADARELMAFQERLARERPEPWSPRPAPLVMAGCALVSRRGARPHAAGPGPEPGFAAATLFEVGAGPPRACGEALVTGTLAAPFVTGLLALREGPLLASAVRALPRVPDVVLVHAAGRDHPRRAGLALMLGAALGLPSFGVTTRPLVATGEQPGPGAGDTTLLVVGAEVVACWLRTRPGVRPVVAHAGWRIGADGAAALALAACSGHRTPEPLRRALELARAARVS